MTTLGIEEEFDAVLENYIEFESELLSVALNHMVHHGSLNWVRFNRRLANFLSMARAYSDHVRHRSGGILGSLPNPIPALFSREYDSSFEFRFMESLRNHVQHQELPITGTTYHSSWEDRDAQPMQVLQFSTGLQLDLEQIRANSRLSAKMKAELKGLESPPDLAFMVRKYVEGLSRIHKDVRDALEKSTATAKEVLLQAFKKSRSRFGDRRHLDVVSLEPDGRLVEEVVVTKDFIERVDGMRRRNSPLPTLSQWHVSGEIRRQKIARR